MRADRDNWDITTSVGSTALLVAAARALEARRDDALAVDPYAEVFCRAVGGEWADVLDGRAPGHQLATEFGEVFRNFQATRTRYFDDYFRGVAAAGVQQIVILAAGLDSRAYRLNWARDTVVFELDQPKVLQFKREVLARRGDAPRAERREVAVDLREDWPIALQDSGFDLSRPSAWLVEGLLVYLPAAAERDLFTGIDSLAGPGSRVAVEDVIVMDQDAFEAARTEDEWFSLVYNEKHAAAAEWFGARGWTTAATPLTDYFRECGRPLPPADSQGGQMVNSVVLVTATRG